MAELKTRPNEASVIQFLDSIEDDQKREDCYEVLKMMKEVTGAEAQMWGTAIIGFGSYHFKYASGKEGDWMEVGFSPRKQNLSLYILTGFKRFDELMGHLGKYKTGKSCLYIKRLDDVDRDVLEQLVRESVAHIRATHSAS